MAMHTPWLRESTNRAQPYVSINSDFCYAVMKRIYPRLSHEEGTQEVGESWLGVLEDGGGEDERADHSELGIRNHIL